MNRGLRDRLARKRRKKKSPLILPLLFLFPFSSGSYLATPTPKKKKGLNSPYARIKDFFVKDFSFRLEWINFPDNFFGDFNARLNLCRTQVTSWVFFALCPHFQESFCRTGIASSDWAKPGFPSKNAPPPLLMAGDIVTA